MVMKKKDVIALNSIFLKLKDFGSTKFKYTILKNLTALKNHIKDLENAESEIKTIIKDFEEEKNQLIISIGKPINDGRFYIDQNDEEMMLKFNSEVSKLLKKYEEEIKNYNDEVSEYQEILEEEVEEEIKFRKINLDNCPESEISFSDLEKLNEFEIINE